MKNFILILMTALLAPAAFAQTTPDELNLAPIEITGVQIVKPGDTKIIPLPRYTYIDRLSLEVDTGIFCKKSPLQISFDGYNTRSVDVDGGLRGYRTKILRADVRTRTLEVTNTSSCKIKIKNIQILPKRWHEGRGHDHGHGNGHGPHGPVYLPASDAAAQVSFLLETYQYLEQLVGDAERVQFITPIKKAVGKALAILNSTPETSQAAVAAIKDVLAQLKAGHTFIDRLATVEATFEAAQEIQSIEASLTRMVQ